jgi:PAS domain S-box-containing protein
MGSDWSVFDASPDAFLFAEEERIVWASAGAGRMLDATPQALVGRALEELLGHGERERLRVVELQRKDGWDIPATCRVRFVRVSDGREVSADLRISAVPARGPNALILSARDVTDGTRAEQLMGQLARLSASGTAMLDANALLEASEPLFIALGWKVAFTELLEQGSITLRVLAAAPGDPVGDYARSIVGVPMPLAKTPVLAEVVRTGRAIFLDNLPTLGEGPERHATALGASMTRAQVIRSAWCPVLTDGRMTHLLTVVGRDLTEHDFVAVQLFAAQVGAANRVAQLRAEVVHRERLAAVGQMAAVLAHEVRNPLAVMFNALAGLRRPANAPQGGAELLGIIQEEAERLQRLVTDLLDFARPSAPQMQALTVTEVIKQAIAAARQDPACPDAREVVLDIAPNLPMALSDAHFLRHALVNLIVNAHQSVTPGGKVTLSAARSGDRELRIEVHNDGTPIPPERAARIFEPFYTTKATGTGLGLAVVRRLLGDLDGRVALEPSNDGVSFALWLPIISERATA